MNELEEERKKYLKSKRNYRNISRIMIIILFLACLVFLGGKSEYKEFLIILTIICVLSFFAVGRDYGNNKSNYEEYRKKYRELIVDSVLNEMFSDVETDYGKGIDKGTILSTNIIHVGSSFYSEDHIKGKYKDISFEVSDIHTYHRDEDGERVTDFKGQYYVFEFNKEFKGSIRVLYNDQDKIYKKNSDYVELEDEEFNNNFTVLAKDKHLAYYILTPSFIEKIKEIAYKVGGVNFIFIDNQLHIAVYNDEDLFEFDPNKKIDPEAEKGRIRNTLADVMKIIDILKLNDKLFK